MRRMAPVDRAITLLVGVVLLAAAATALAWREGVVVSDRTLDVSWLGWRVHTEWWPWAVGTAGAVLVLFGLTLAVGHLPRRRVSVIRPGGAHSRSGLVDSDVLVSTVRDRIHEIDGVRAARGRIRRERDHLVMSFVVTVEPSVSLRHTVSELDDAATMGAYIAHRDDLAKAVSLVDRGLVSMVVGMVRPLDEVNEVFEALEEGAVVGRAVLEVMAEPSEVPSARGPSDIVSAD